MNTLSIVVLHNKNRGNNQFVAGVIAEYLGCDKVAAEDDPCIADYDIVVVVVPNAGDEELPQPMEDYLFVLTATNKKYLVCELGNLFGFESYGGCKKVVFKILDALGWQLISDVSLDSLPTLDRESLDEWLLKIELRCD
jgi:flavodoxin